MEKDGKKALLGFAENTTAHGISRLTAGSLWKRMVWLALIIGAVTGFAYHLSILITKYRTFPVSAEYKEDENSFEFPSVTICPTNSISAYGKLTDTIESEYKVPGIKRSVSKMIYDVPRIWHTIQNHSTTHRFSHRNFWNTRLSFKQIAYRGKQFQEAHDTILYCKYNNKPCSYRNFTEYKDPQYFMCFTFTPDNNTILNAGEKSGLYLLLYNTAQGFLTEEEEIDAVEGFMVATHRSNTLPSMNTFVQVPWSYKVSAPLQMKKTIKVNRITKPCVNSRPKITYIVDWSQNISESATFVEQQEDCIIRSKHMEFLEECNCLADHIPIPKDLFSKALPCHTLYEEAFFLDNSYEKIAKNEFYYTIRTNASLPRINITDYIYGVKWPQYQQSQKNIFCFDKVNDRQLEEGVVTKCLPDCSKVNYEVNSIHMTWPRDSNKAKLAIDFFYEKTWKKMQKDNLTTIIVKKQSSGEFDYKLKFMSVLDLFVASSTVEVLNEDYAYPLGNLFSDLGGILGLWVGVSIITIAEVLELIILLSILTGKKLGQKNQIDPMPTKIPFNKEADRPSTKQMVDISV